MENKSFAIYESALGGEALQGPVDLSDVRKEREKREEKITQEQVIVKRGLDSELKAPKGEDNCQFSVVTEDGTIVTVSAPNFAQVSERREAEKSV